MIVLGLNTWFHDTSACIVRDGKLVVALEEERFSRDKHTRAFPKNAITRCLEVAGIGYADIDHIAVSIKPLHRWFAKVLYATKAPHKSISFIRHELLAGYFKQKRFRQWLNTHWPDKHAAGRQRPTVHQVQHHLAHAAGSFYVSPYKDAAIMAIDGSGEWACAWLGEGHDTQLTCYNESNFPHSLGSVYEAVTEFCGFRPNYDEGKTMGLAPLGDATRFIDEARKTVSVDNEGQLHVNLDYFSYQFWGYKRCSALFHRTFGKPREQDGEFETHHQDAAAAFQQVLEECALAMATVLKNRSGARYLVIAGGVALNSVMNGRLLREAGFDDVYIMPAAGDNGTCIGAAYTVLHDTLKLPRTAVHDNPFVGNEYDDEHIQQLLTQYKLSHRRSSNIAVDAAALLEQGHIIGWFQGRMEIGPRALGARSILANPAFPDMKQKINSEVKFREAYRPFAPSATVEAAAEFFDIDVEAPFMLKVCQVRAEKRPLLPAITHVDGSARLQTVRRETNPRFHALIQKLGQRTGIPVVLNTSFNIQGEPVVESPRDAIRCFYSTGLDYLVLGSFIIGKDFSRSEQT